MAMQLQGGQYIDLSAGNRQEAAMRQAQTNELANQMGAQRQRVIAALDAQVAPYIQQYGMEGFAVLNPELAARWAQLKGLPAEALKPALQAGMAMRQNPGQATQVLEQLRNTTGWNSDQSFNTLQALTQYQGQPKPQPQSTEEFTVGGSLVGGGQSGGGGAGGGGGTPAPVPTPTPNRAYKPVPSTDFDPTSMIRGGKPSVDMQQQNKAVGSTEGQYAYGDVLKRAAETTQQIAALKESAALEQQAGSFDQGRYETTLNQLTTDLANTQKMMANIASTPEGKLQKAKVDKAEAEKLLKSGQIRTAGQAEEARRIIQQSDAIISQAETAAKVNKAVSGTGANPPTSSTSASTPAATSAAGAMLTEPRKFIFDSSSTDAATTYVKRALTADVQSGKVLPETIDTIQNTVFAPDAGVYFDTNGKVTGPKRAELEKLPGGASVLAKYEAVTQNILSRMGPGKTTASAVLTMATGGWPQSEAEITRAADQLGKTVSDPGKKLTVEEFGRNPVIPEGQTSQSYADYEKAYNAQLALYNQSKSRPNTASEISKALSPYYSSLVDGLVSGDPVLTTLYPGRAQLLTKLSQEQMNVLKTGTEAEQQRLANEVYKQYGALDAKATTELKNAQAAYYLAQANAERLKFMLSQSGVDPEKLTGYVDMFKALSAIPMKDRTDEEKKAYSQVLGALQQLVMQKTGMRGTLQEASNLWDKFFGRKESGPADYVQQAPAGTLTTDATVLGGDPVGSIMKTVNTKTPAATTTTK